MEKTFEELIEAKKASIRYEKITDAEIIELLNQVREATIAGCAEIYDADWGKYVGYKKMLELPTDRILITKNYRNE